MSNLWEKQWVRGLAVIGAVAGFLIWEFGIKAPAERAEEYTGTISEVYRTRDWLRGFKKPGEPGYRYYDHYWAVKTESGESLDVELPHAIWQRADAGDPVRKAKGQRYPDLDTEEARRNRPLRQQAVKWLVDGAESAISQEQPEQSAPSGP